MKMHFLLPPVYGLHACGHARVAAAVASVASRLAPCVVLHDDVYNLPLLPDLCRELKAAADRAGGGLGLVAAVCPSRSDPLGDLGGLRFRRVEFELPGGEERRRCLEKELQKLEKEPGFDLGAVAKRTEGLPAGDLEELTFNVRLDKRLAATEPSGRGEFGDAVMRAGPLTTAEALVAVASFRPGPRRW